MSDNKLVKTNLDAATLTGIGWIAKKVVKENFTPDPSSNVMNYAKFTAAMAGSIALKRYLEDQKILPDSKIFGTDLQSGRTQLFDVCESFAPNGFITFPRAKSTNYGRSNGEGCSRDRSKEGQEERIRLTNRR